MKGYNKIALFRIIILVIVSVLGILLIGIYRLKPANPIITEKCFWIEKANTSKKYNILFTGDSRTYRDISPKIVLNELSNKSLTAYNLGFSAGGFNPLMYDFFDKCLNNSNPRIIVMGLTPLSLMKYSEKNEQFLQEYHRNWKDVYAYLYFKPLLLFFERASFNEIFYKKTPTPSGYYMTYEPLGWVASHVIPIDTSSGLKNYRERFSEGQVEPYLLNALLKQIRIWKSKNVQVVIFRPPTCSAMDTLEAHRGGFNEAVIKKDVIDAGAVWLDIDDKQSFISYDGSHLKCESAILLSKQIGQKLKQLYHL